jgi:DHA1 family bicyclomycin/chloramphenicol resistance-like MFS transporter
MRVRQNTGAAGAGRRIGVPLLVTLALLAAVPPLATDLYLPAFPAMTDNLSTSSAAVQLSLTAFLIGAGVGQVIFGPVSDRTGRVPPLVAGLAVYVAASAGAALAPTAGVLIGARLIQGLSGAAGMVIGRAVISDLAEGAQAARAFSAMMLVSGVAPVVGPLAGSTLAGSVGWRGLLWIVAVLGAISLAARRLGRARIPPGGEEARGGRPPGLHASAALARVRWQRPGLWLRLRHDDGLHLRLALRLPGAHRP